MPGAAHGNQLSGSPALSEGRTSFRVADNPRSQLYAVVQRKLMFDRADHVVGGAFGHIELSGYRRIRQARRHEHCVVSLSWTEGSPNVARGGPV